MTRFAEMWDDGFVGAWARAIAVLGAAPKPASVAGPTVAQAMKVVTDALRADPDYAWSWHCNITMAMVDEGLDHALAEHGAQRFLNLLCPGPVLVPAHPLRPKPAQQADTQNAHLALAHELWAMAQLAPGEGIEDGAARIAARLAQSAPVQQAGERERFEAWARTKNISLERWVVNEEMYEDPEAIGAWSAWQARAALSAPASAQEAGELEDWLGAYWDAGYNEGKTGANNADRANEALHNIRKLFRAAKAEPVAEFRGRRLTPEGTAEFWGVMLCDPMRDPPKGAKLYLGPVNDPVPSDWRSVIPGGRFTDKGESCRVADFNEGWNAYRKAAIANLAAHRATQQAQATSPVADELLDAYMHACGRSDLAARDEVRRRLAAMLSQQAQASESLIALPPLPAIQTTNVHEQAHIHELREQNTKLREWLTHWRLRAQQFERHFASKQASESAEARDAGQALDLLAILFDAYENGAPCFDDPDEGSFIGNAVRLSNDDFHRCADLLNKHRPAQHKEQT